MYHVIFNSGVGDVSIWEFSGYEPYYLIYDHFVGDPNCIHIVVFSLKDHANIRRAQLDFWLNFIRARMAPAEPIGRRWLWFRCRFTTRTNANN